MGDHWPFTRELRHVITDPLTADEYDRAVLQAWHDQENSGSTVVADIPILKRLIAKGYVRLATVITPEGKRFMEGQ